MKAWTSLGATLLLTISSALPASAGVLPIDQRDYVGHQIDCLGMLFTNPATHATECGGPFSLPDSPHSIGSGGSGSGSPCVIPQGTRFDQAQPSVTLQLVIYCGGCSAPTAFLSYDQGTPQVMPVYCEVTEIDNSIIQG